MRSALLLLFAVALAASLGACTDPNTGNSNPNTQTSHANMLNNSGGGAGGGY